ncbi:MAG: class I SAM-dependent methyltransferase [Eggerthellaceae bacterium]|nr:class I SAM-dependent methyltransferase [Eggerthellaceae bacterium]
MIALEGDDVDDATIRRLAELNRRFYEENLEGFSATRGSAWPGWLELARMLGDRLPGIGDGGRPLRVLDIASGNLRFERFLAEVFPEAGIQVLAIDSCDGLALAQLETLPANAGVHYEHADMIDLLMGEGGPGSLPDFGGITFDVAVSFGFMHHVPGHALRSRLLRLMAEALAPGGVLAVSFWRFMDDAQLADRAHETTARAQTELGDLQLGRGDFILGWNGVPGAYRYCHSFDDAEIDALANAVGGNLDLAARYRADGRTGDLNEYLVFQRI